MNKERIEQTHGTFFGSSLTKEDCEVFSIAFVDRKLLKKEPELYGTKWFDYRELHPVMATYLFAHHYNKAFGEFMRVNKNHKLRYMAAFKGKDVIKAKEAKSFWRLRQIADAHGVRYDFFMNEVMRWCANRGWRQPPRPAHVSSNEEMLADILIKWEGVSNEIIQWAMSERYRASNYVGAADQRAYEDVLCRQIKSKRFPHFSLYTALYQYDALRIERAILEFPEETVREAMNMFKIAAQKSVSADYNNA